MSDVSGFLTGFSNSLNSYLQTNNQNKQAQQNELYKNQLAEQSKMKEQAANQQAELAKSSALEKQKVGLEDQLSPDMAESVLPGHGAKMVQEYNTSHPDSPLKLKDGVAYLKTAADALAPADTSKQDNHQDALEGQAIGRISSVRGDAAVARAELQRDAAGQAYDTISKAQHENRDLSSLEQTDLLAQLFQARVGKAPTDSDMKAINEKTAKQSLNQAVTYVTGNPQLVGATTQGTLNNLKQFILATGEKADLNHEGYMAPHLIKPTGLSQDRWEHILASHRGISFADQMKTSDKTYSAEAKKASTQSSGWSYVGPVK